MLVVFSVCSGTPVCILIKYLQNRRNIVESLRNKQTLKLRLQNQRRKGNVILEWRHSLNPCCSPTTAVTSWAHNVTSAKATMQRSNPRRLKEKLSARNIFIVPVAILIRLEELLSYGDTFKLSIGWNIDFDTLIFHKIIEVFYSLGYFLQKY